MPRVQAEAQRPGARPALPGAGRAPRRTQAAGEEGAQIGHVGAPAGAAVLDRDLHAQVGGDPGQLAQAGDEGLPAPGVRLRLALRRGDGDVVRDQDRAAHPAEGGQSVTIDGEQLPPGRLLRGGEVAPGGPALEVGVDRVQRQAALGQPAPRLVEPAGVVVGEVGVVVRDLHGGHAQLPELIEQFRCERLAVRREQRRGAETERRRPAGAPAWLRGSGGRVVSRRSVSRGVTGRHAHLRSGAGPWVSSSQR